MEFDGFGRITYLCVSDEEIEQRHSHDLLRRVAREADVALTLEAARENGDIVTARKGMRRFLIEAFGRAAHAGVEPEKGRSAIVALAHHLLALHELNGLRPGVTVQRGPSRAAPCPNAVPEHAQMQVDIRGFTNEDLDAVTDAIRAQLAKEVVPGVAQTMTRQGPGSPPMPRTPQVASLEGLAQQVARELGFEINGREDGRLLGCRDRRR
jgi:glutamate carboxypeptidase